MNGASAIARILQQEGVESLSCFPANPIIEAAANLGIRPIICRQERAGVNIADGYSRASFGNRFGVFAMQYGPGAENAYGGVAQAFADSVPILLPQLVTKDQGPALIQISLHRKIMLESPNGRRVLPTHIKFQS